MITNIEKFFIPPDATSYPKILKNIEGIFSLQHNIGLIGEGIDNLSDAMVYYSNVSCDEPIYIKKVNGNIYISKSIFYLPVIHSFISKQVTYVEVIYRWNQVSNTGILLQSIVLNN